MQGNLIVGHDRRGVCATPLRTRQWHDLGGYEATPCAGARRHRGRSVIGQEGIAAVGVRTPPADHAVMPAEIWGMPDDAGQVVSARSVR